MCFRFPFLYPLLALPVPFAVDCQQIAPDTPETPFLSTEAEGSSYDDLNTTVTQAINLYQVQSLLNGTKHRVLFTGFQPEPEINTETKFEAVIYDYTRGRSIVLSGVPFDPTTVSITEANIQPPISSEELAEAGSMAGAYSDEIVTDGMPPVITNDFPDGTSHRILNIAIIGKNSSRSALVNMNDGTVEFPIPSYPSISECTVPLPAGSFARDPLSFRASGSAKIKTRDPKTGKVLWDFEAVRPVLSSGRKGSGIELKNVYYKGRKVLARAHVPILNVEYQEPRVQEPWFFGRCGPYYRDWQNEEYPFRCTGSETIAPGFRNCTSPPKTILDNPAEDRGYFAGVGVYYDGPELVLKSQLKAGWYRYVSEWKFFPDGTLWPRFGFGAVSHVPQCACQLHNHHVYWRLDFDIGTSDNNLVRESNNGIIEDIMFETRRPKDASQNRHWEISNTRTGNIYSLIPGTNDGISDLYSVGDFWMARFHDGEFDDGVTVKRGSACETRANIDKFLTGERVDNNDVVIWYGAHFKHDQINNKDANPVVGPTILPVRW